MIRSPGFWDRPPASPGLAARLLAPAAAVWTAATRRRLVRPGLRVGVPVVCVGNLTAGGAGKTPTVMALLERLAARGAAAAVISRGHGGALTGPLRVDPSRHVAADVGDEPLLMAALAPVWVGRDRAAAARAAAADGAAVLVLDDGYQNPDPAKDMSILVVDAAAGFGNGRVIPAGPLREPVPAGLARADLVLAVGSAEERAALRAAWPALHAFPALDGEILPLRTGMDWRGLKVLAFAGIGRPEKFFRSLRDAGAELAAAHGFADHAPFSERLLARLSADAGRLGAQIVTTEKDAVRLPPEFRARVLTLPVRLVVRDWTPADERLDRLGLGGGEGKGEA